MNGAVNGFSINGTVLPSWVVRAVVVATAAATVASSEPTLKFAGASVATATATGNGAVRRDVWATAGGDATCTADALTAQAIGEAQATAVSTVDLALAHIIHPGRSVTLCKASSSASGDVTRYAVAFLTYGYAGPSWGEASVKRNGNSYFEHDGYSLATSTATSLVEQDKTKIIATLGTFDFGNGTSGANSFIVYSALATGTASNTAQTVPATHIYRQTASASGTATGSADGTRVVMPTATGQADSLTYGPKARIKYVATGTSNAASSAVQALGVRMAMAQQDGATAGATVKADASAAFAASATGSLAMAVTLDSTPTLTQAARATGAPAVSMVGRAYALANSEIRAPDDRYMIVGQEVRAMIVSAEERMMVVTA